jgi:hypothetical protein
MSTQDNNNNVNEVKTSTIDCDCECTYDTALYFNECSTRPDQNPEANLKFLPAPYVSSSPNPGVTDISTKDIFGSLKDKVTDGLFTIADAATDQCINYLNTKGNELIDQGVSKLYDVVSKGSSGGKGGKGSPPSGRTGGNGKGGGNNNNNPHSYAYRGGSARLSYDAKPIEIRLNTGIKPNTYSSIFETGVSAYTSPLHLTICDFQIPSNSERLDAYFTKVVSFIFTNLLQQSVSFNLDVTNNLTPTKLKTALNSVLYCLGIYYFFNSILTFTENTQNRNEGMQALRTNLTAQDMSNLLDLKKILKGLPIPPNFISFMFYLNQSYTFTDTPGSPVMKLSFVPFSSTTKMPDSSVIASCVSGLLTDDNKKIFSLLARCCPKWVGLELPDIAWNPLYDPNFNTIWSNLPAYDYNGTTERFAPEATNSSTPIKYVSWTNDLDGAAFALTCIHKTGTLTTSALWYPTFITPNKAFVYSGAKITNRVYFSMNGLFDNSNDQVVCAMQRLESNLICPAVTGITANIHHFGSQRCEQVTGDSVTESSLKLLDYLMSMDTIGSIKDNRIYKNKK